MEVNESNAFILVFQEHPYIFTKVNSFPSVITTPAPLIPDSLSVPVWLAAVLAIVGLLIGCAVTSLLLSWRAKRRERMTTAEMEMKDSAF